jgi:hypothetical protein
MLMNKLYEERRFADILRIYDKHQFYNDLNPTELTPGFEFATTELFLDALVETVVFSNLI